MYGISDAFTEFYFKQRIITIYLNYYGKTQFYQVGCDGSSC